MRIFVEKKKLGANNMISLTFTQWQNLSKQENFFLQNLIKTFTKKIPTLAGIILLKISPPPTNKFDQFLSAGNLFGRF